MYKVQRLWRYFHQRRLSIDLDILYCKNFSSISKTNGDKHSLEQTIFTPTKWEIRRAEKLFYSIGPKTVLHESAQNFNTFTKLKEIPEVAFLGRTSVGKSSLINALLHQKKLAKTSKTPGHTKLINYFNVGSKFYLVDLPGYGYVEGQGAGGQYFVKVVENYLKARADRQLRSICLLIDGKVGIKKNDLIAVEMLEEMNAPFHIAVTKMDKVNKETHDLINKQIKKEIQKLSSLFFPHIFSVSSKEKTGLSELRCFIGLCTGILN